jgi:hypothetical protein
MPIRVITETDVAKMAARVNGTGRKACLEVLTASELVAQDLPEPRMRIKTMLPAAGAVTIIGKSKSGKTVKAVQIAISVASNHPLMDYYEVLDPGPVLVIEQDDPAGNSSIQMMLKRSPIAVTNNFHFAARMPVAFGLEFIGLLEAEIRRLGLKLVILDSYTAMRSNRGAGVDIVKAEEQELKQLDELGKRTNSTIGVIHHVSHGSSPRDWSEQAGGTFAMYSAVEGQIHISRLPEFDGAPERLIHARARHGDDVAMIVRFRPETLDYEHVLEGPAADSYPLLVQIRSTFDERPFSPKELCHGTGVSRATAHRQIDRLYRAGALTKRGFGEYVLSVGVLR